MHKILLFSCLLLLHFSVNAQLKEGFIIDQHGAKYPGSLKIKDMGTLIYKSPDDNKKETLTVNDLKAFKIEEDSFIVVRNYKVPQKKIILNGFAKVILRANTNILCALEEQKSVKTASGSVYTNGITHYLLYRNGQFDLITGYNFYREMPSVVSANELLKNKIVSKKLKFDDLEQIAFEYESWRKTVK